MSKKQQHANINAEDNTATASPVELIFKSRIRGLIDRSGNSQAEIAKKTSISPQQINEYYNGGKRPDIRTLAKLSRGLKVSTDYLLGISDVPAIDKDVRAAAEITGLSPKSIEALERINSNRAFPPCSAAIDTLNSILEKIHSDSDTYLWGAGVHVNFDIISFAAAESLLFSIHNYIEVSKKDFNDKEFAEIGINWPDETIFTGGNKNIYIDKKRLVLSALLTQIGDEIKILAEGGAE